MTLNKLVYDAVIFNKKIAVYKSYDEYWYVVEWGKKVYLHYTTKQKSKKLIIHWFLCDNTLWPKWRCQTDIIEV